MTDAVSELVLDAMPEPLAEIDLGSNRDPEILARARTGRRVGIGGRDKITNHLVSVPHNEDRTTALTHRTEFDGTTDTADGMVDAPP
ncbi:MAG: hypothetical protein AB7R00_08870 [Kofleriaceae bacterium]